MKTKVILLTFAIGCIIGLLSCQKPTATIFKDETTKNKAVAEKIFKAFDEGNADALDSFIVSNPIDHTEMPPEIKSTGLAAIKEMCKMQKAAFPDMKSTINSMIAERDMVAIYFTSEATNNGPFMGKPATGKHIKTDGIDIIKFKDGKAVEHWGVYDNLKMMQQLGVIPEMKPTTKSDSVTKK